MVYREHGRTSARFLVMGLLVVGSVGSAILADACRVEGSLPLHKMINGDTVQLESRRGITTLNGEQADGTVFYLNGSGDTIALTPFRNGKENGDAIFRYDDGTVKEIRRYSNGKKTGTHYGWYNNGQQMFEYNYTADEFNGDYKEWYSN